jgi:hypothetical protein
MSTFYFWRFRRQKWTLHRDLEKARLAKLRELIQRMVERIELPFDAVPKAKRTDYPYSRGPITLRPDASLSRLECRGDWTAIELFWDGLKTWPSSLIHSGQRVLGGSDVVAGRQRR